MNKVTYVFFVKLSPSSNPNSVGGLVTININFNTQPQPNHPQEKQKENTSEARL